MGGNRYLDRAHAYRVAMFVQDGLYDLLFGEGWLDTVPDDVAELAEVVLEEPLTKLVCDFMGHYPVKDHCGMPKHDQCAVCMKLMPGEAHKKTDTP